MLPTGRPSFVRLNTLFTFIENCSVYNLSAQPAEFVASIDERRLRKQQNEEDDENN